jgi:hypothetical protein
MGEIDPGCGCDLTTSVPNPGSLFFFLQHHTVQFETAQPRNGESQILPDRDNIFEQRRNPRNGPANRPRPSLG